MIDVQPQHNSASYESTGENCVSSSGLDQSTKHRCNTDSKNNDDLQSYEIPQKKTVPTLLMIQYPPQPNHYLQHCLRLENNKYVLKCKGKVPIQHNVQNQEH